MARKKQRLEEKKQKKEPVELAARTGSRCGENVLSDSNCTTSESNNQGISDGQSETQIFNPTGNYRQPVSDEEKARNWLFIIYEESAPSDWKERMINTGIPFTISEWHDQDVNPDGSKKKKHLHMIVSYPNTTTYRNIKELRKITNGPFPLKCHSVSGAYAYFTHKWNPEKYQYSGVGIERYNGWEKALEACDINRIKIELTMLCFMEDITDYCELIAETLYMDGDYQQVAMNNTVYFDRLVSSYRHSPIKALHRLYGKLKTDEEREIIQKRIEYYEEKEVEIEEMERGRVAQ